MGHHTADRGTRLKTYLNDDPLSPPRAAFLGCPKTKLASFFVMCCGFDIFQNMKSPLKQWPLCQPPPIQIDTVNPPTDQSSINQSVHWPSRTLDYYRRSLSRCCTAPRPPLQCHCSQWGISIAVSGQFDLAFLNHRHIHIHVHIPCPRRETYHQT